MSEELTITQEVREVDGQRQYRNTVNTPYPVTAECSDSVMPHLNVARDEAGRPLHIDLGNGPVVRYEVTGYDENADNWLLGLVGEVESDVEPWAAA